MGYQVGSSCLADLTTAHASFFSKFIPSSSVSGSSVYEVFFQLASVYSEPSPSGWVRVVQKSSLYGIPQGTVIVQLDAVAFPSCNYSEPFTDGMALGWLVGSVLVAVAAIKYMRRGV